MNQQSNNKPGDNGQQAVRYTMKGTFEKNNLNTIFYTEDYFLEIFAKMGFTAKRITISLVNGCSAYITVNVKVLNVSKMYYDVFVFEDRATLNVRISDHDSNLERICDGVSGNKLSFDKFRFLVDNNIIIDANA